MFKAFGNFIHRTPWWAMVLLGFSILILMIAFSAPTHIMRLAESGATPDERRAIKREIERAVGDSALGMAENIVGTIKARSNDPMRKEELQSALEEIAQARRKIYDARRDATNAGKEAEDAAREAVREAEESALDAARSAAESALEAAKEAREAIEEAKTAAAEQLKTTGADTTAALAAFDQMIRQARDKEKVAEDAVRKIKDARKRSISIGIGDEGLKIDAAPPAPAGVPAKSAKPATPAAPATPKTPRAAADPAAPAPPAPPAVPGGNRKGGVKFDGDIEGNRIKGNIDITDSGIKGDIDIDDDGKVAINLPSLGSLPPLPPELRSDIRSTVASDVRRVGIGSAMVLAFIPIFIMMLIAKYFIDRSRRAQAFAEQKKQEADVSNVNRQITEARLQALQAQVEPHFLYNTLANVQALTEVDPAQANQMTGHLIQYLRSSLPKMRENTSTVGQEIELVRAYLNILRMRMGERLAFSIDCPEEMLRISFPPMMLPSLVENAIKHGLEPQKEGGRIDVIVSPVTTSEGKRIRVTVKDTGRGLTDTPTQAGGGVGLTNIRERLIAIYGEAGKLTLESNEPRGVVASIEVPAEAGSAATTTIGQFAAGPAPAQPAKPIAPDGWWGKTRYAIAATHGVWAKIMSKTFIVLMVALAVVFGLTFAAMLTGMLPVNFGNTHLDGVEGMALGSLLLLAGFGVVALVLLIVVGILYGIGLLVGGLLLIVPLIILIGSFPALAPFILIGGLAYWFFFKRGRKPTSGDRPG